MAIAFDAATLSAVDDTNVTTITFSHTVGAGTHRGLVVIVMIQDDNPRTEPAVTYGGVSMGAAVASAVVSTGVAPYARVWMYYMQNPTAGAANVAVANPGGTGTPELYKAIAISVNSSAGAITVGDTDTLAYYSNTTAPNSTLSPVTANDFLVDGGIANFTADMVIGADQTSRALTTIGPAATSSYLAEVFSSTQPGSSGGVMSWTRSATACDLAYVAAVLVEAAGASTTVTPATATLTLTTFAPTVSLLSFEEALSDESDSTYVELVSANSPSMFSVTLAEAQQPGSGTGTLTIRAERLAE